MVLVAGGEHVGLVGLVGLVGGTQEDGSGARRVPVHHQLDVAVLHALRREGRHLPVALWSRRRQIKVRAWYGGCGFIIIGSVSGSSIKRAGREVRCP